MYSVNWEWEWKVVCDSGGKWKVSNGAEHEVITDRGEEKEKKGGRKKRRKRKNLGF